LTEKSEEEIQIERMIQLALSQATDILTVEMLRANRDEKIVAQKALRGSHMNIIEAENAKRKKQRPR
jgi:hypothetical protein